MIRIATKRANESKFRRARVGACVVRGDRIMSTGVNRIGYSKFGMGRKHVDSIHAEAQAILALLKSRRSADLVGATIFVSRVGKRGDARLAKPCDHCARLIESVGIDKVVYTTNAGTTEEYRV